MCFNPCFNGCCARITLPQATRCGSCSFNPCFNGCCARIQICPPGANLLEIVSILVLMDVAPESFLGFGTSSYCPCFNPCFNGCCARMVEFCHDIILLFCFNPCFNGCCARMPLD